MGWSLEHQHRPALFGFHSKIEETAPVDHLEPILMTGEGHLLTVAPTGAGKGTGCIIPALLRYEGPVVVIDPKGENYAVTAKRRREMGQQVILLDPFKITGEENTDTFNPLDILDPAGPMFVENTAMLVSLLIKGRDGEQKDIFWSDMGKLLLTALILYQLTELDPEDHNLAKTRDLIGLSMEDLKTLGQKLKNSYHDEVRRLASILFNPASETLGGYLAYAQQQIEFLKGSLIERNTSGSSFSLDQISSGEPISIYLVLPPDKFESHGKLLRLWIGLFMASIMKRRRKVEPATLFIIDEAAQLGTLPQLRQAITLLRGYGVKVWSFWQDVSQIQHLYPTDWKTIYNNCKVHQFFGISTYFAAKAAHEITGFPTVERILELDHNEMILSISGDVPVIASKANYLIDAPFRGLFDNNPFYEKEELRQEGYIEKRVYQRDAALGQNGKTTSHFQRRMTFKVAMNKAASLHPVKADRWCVVKGGEKEELIKTLSSTSAISLEELASYSYRKWDLACYKDHSYYEASYTAPDDQIKYSYFVMHDNNGTVLSMDGKSIVIHELNSSVQLKLTENQVLDYILFFSSNILSQYGRFLIIDDVDDIAWKVNPSSEVRESLQNELYSPRLIRKTEKYPEIPGSYWVDVCLNYGDSLSKVLFVVTSDGSVEMMEDELFAKDLPVIRDIDRMKNLFLILGMPGKVDL